jgi:hypothetical protein
MNGTILLSSSDPPLPLPSPPCHFFNTEKLKPPHPPCAALASPLYAALFLSAVRTVWFCHGHSRRTLLGAARAFSFFTPFRFQLFRRAASSSPRTHRQSHLSRKASSWNCLPTPKPTSILLPLFAHQSSSIHLNSSRAGVHSLAQ